jgi:hypothetical protein
LNHDPDALALIEQRFLAECDEDYVGLWSVVRRFERAGVVDHYERQQMVLLLLAKLLSHGKIKAGQFSKQRSDARFYEWTTQPHETIQRIEQEWRQLGRDPDIGEIVWFVSPLQ